MGPSDWLVMHAIYYRGRYAINYCYTYIVPTTGRPRASAMLIKRKRLCYSIIEYANTYRRPTVVSYLFTAADRTKSRERKAREAIQEIGIPTYISDDQQVLITRSEISSHTCIHT